MRPELAKLLEESCSNQDSPHLCALARLVTEHPEFTGGDAYASLSTAGQNAGFTQAEAYGIMDGWDNVTYHDAPPIFLQWIKTVEGKAEYDVGYKLGVTMARRYA